VFSLYYFSNKELVQMIGNKSKKYMSNSVSYFFCTEIFKGGRVGQFHLWIYYSKFHMLIGLR